MFVLIWPAICDGWKLKEFLFFFCLSETEAEAINPSFVRFVLVPENY